MNPTDNLAPSAVSAILIAVNEPMLFSMTAKNSTSVSDKRLLAVARTCAVFGMPKETIRMDAAARIVPLDRIPDALIAGR
ncbi:MAG: hypothetical protein IPO00_05275 [Betaproteobacteria bacterium]|nr:hypothetical protein [Betaproteobacteria bacterium]